MRNRKTHMRHRSPNLRYLSVMPLHPDLRNLEYDGPVFLDLLGSLRSPYGAARSRQERLGTYCASIDVGHLDSVRRQDWVIKRYWKSNPILLTSKKLGQKPMYDEFEIAIATVFRTQVCLGCP